MQTATRKHYSQSDTTERRQVEWTALLHRALTVPGVMSDAYRQFHRYSVLNQIEILTQCMSRGIQPGPIATYKRWAELGRQVVRGSKALGMWQPVTRKTITTDPQTGTEKQISHMFLVCALQCYTFFEFLTF